MLVAELADVVDVLVEPVPVFVAIVDEVAKDVEALAELDERPRESKTQAPFEQVDSLLPPGFEHFTPQFPQL